MPNHRTFFTGLFLLLVPAAVGGCSGSKTESPALNEEEKPKAEGLQPLNAPPLAEIDAKAEWIDMPVEDGLQLLQVELKKSKPPLSVAEALKLKNDSDKANTEILETLGRLPEKDADV